MSAKRMRLFPPVLLLILLLAGPAAAQERSRGDWNEDYDPHVAALGLAVGYTSGTGLAVRWPAFPQTMMSLAGGVWGESEDLAWNVGIEAHLVLRQVGSTRLFVGPSFALYSDDEDDDTDANFALGIGLEYLMTERVSLKLDLGFTYLGDDGDVYPLPQLAAFYYF